MNKSQRKKQVKKPQTKTITGLEIIPEIEGLTTNKNLPTLQTDIATVMARSDGIGIISFYSKIHGANIEICRVSMTLSVMENLADIINTHIKEI